VRAAVRRAAERGRRVRAVGSGQSFSPLAVTDDVQLDLSALTGIVRVGAERVRVRAGTTLGALSALLATRGLAPAGLVDVDAPTVGGAVATGLHGSTAGSGSLSSALRGARLVTGDGTAVEVDSSALDAVRTNLGALGVVTEVELAVRTAVTLRTSQARVPLAEALDPEFLDGHRWAEFAVFPYAEDALIRWADEVAEEPPPPSRADAVRTFVERRMVRPAAVGGGVALGRSVPRLVPRINRAATALTGTGSATGPAHRVLVAKPVVRWEETEWALPRASLAEAVRALRVAITRRALDVVFPLEVRVGPAEDGWLHPAYRRETGWVAVHTAIGTDEGPLFDLTAEVLAGYAGRPHWGTRHPWTRERVRAAYPRLADFAALRDRYDPARVFTNPHLERLLG
jgi:L-gulonolactone oxidase